MRHARSIGSRLGAVFAGQIRRKVAYRFRSRVILLVQRDGYRQSFLILNVVLVTLGTPSG
jgi:hypothetical protein